MTAHDARTPVGTRPGHSDGRSHAAGGGRVVWAVGAACLVCCLPPLLAAVGVWTGAVTAAGVWAGPAAAVAAAGIVAGVLALSVPAVRRRRNRADRGEGTNAMTVEIEYCVPCGHLDRAIAAQRAILERFGEQVDGVRLTTGHGGVFTIRVDGEQIYDRTQAFDLDRVIADIHTRL
jgi:selenoprotein W-related protein